MSINRRTGKEDVVHIYNGILKKNEIMPSAATWISLETMILIKSERKRQMNGITYMCNLKNDTNKLIYKTEIDSQTQKRNLWLPMGKGKRE